MNHYQATCRCGARVVAIVCGPHDALFDRLYRAAKERGWTVTATDAPVKLESCRCEPPDYAHIPAADYPHLSALAKGCIPASCGTRLKPEARAAMDEIERLRRENKLLREELDGVSSDLNRLWKEVP